MCTLALVVLTLVLVSSPASGVVVPVAPHPVVADGNLREWGAAVWIPVAPGGGQVGLRGAFFSSEDHTADLYVMWDAKWLHVAAAIVDDSLDVGRIAPDDRKGTGPDGRPKDLMFYYDHLKVFVRGPGEDVGHNVWVAPRQGSVEPYAWGGPQRRLPTEGIPAQVGSATRGTVYTYEISLPWAWLELYPQPGTELDAMFLFVDSDLPGVELRKKMKAETGKWIWWKGVLSLTGEPEGLREPPPPQVPAVRRVPVSTPEPEPVVDGGVARAIARARATRERAEARSAEEGTHDPAGASGPGDAETTPSAAPTITSGMSAGGPDSTTAAASQRYARSMQAVLNRQMLGRRPQLVIPPWVREVVLDKEVSQAQADTYVVTLVQSLSRLVRERANGRTDLFVVDMAARAGTRRGLAHAFLMELVRRYRTQIRVTESAAHKQLKEAAGEAGVPAAVAVDLVDEICQRSLSLYEDGKAGMTRGLVKKAAERVDLRATGAEDLLRALLGHASTGP